MFNQYNPFIYQIPSRFSFQSLLTNTQKTLNIINHAIPVFYQVKPIFNNTKTIFKIMGALKEDDKKIAYAASFGYHKSNVDDLVNDIVDDVKEGLNEAGKEIGSMMEEIEESLNQTADDLDEMIEEATE